MSSDYFDWDTTTTSLLEDILSDALRYVRSRPSGGCPLVYSCLDALLEWMKLLSRRAREGRVPREDVPFPYEAWFNFMNARWEGIRCTVPRGNRIESTVFLANTTYSVGTVWFHGSEESS